MRRPRFARQMVLEVRQTLPDGHGGRDETWVALGQVWADVQARTGRAANGEAGEVSDTGYRITLRGAPHGASNRPRPGQRLRHGARRFAIEAVTEGDALGRTLLCFCREEVAP